MKIHWLDFLKWSEKRTTTRKQSEKNCFPVCTEFCLHLKRPIWRSSLSFIKDYKSQTIYPEIITARNGMARILQKKRWTMGSIQYFLLAPVISDLPTKPTRNRFNHAASRCLRNDATLKDLISSKQLKEKNPLLISCRHLQDWKMSRKETQRSGPTEKRTRKKIMLLVYVLCNKSQKYYFD